ncbi:MAG TPA: glycosyltransferase family 39 protein [Ilumatobacter sp.]
MSAPQPPANPPTSATTSATTSSWPRSTSWWPLLLHALPVYLLSRACVLAGAAVVAAELRVDANLATERRLPFGDPHSTPAAGSAVRPMIDVLTSWDGLWYMDVVRSGYPRQVPPDITYHVDEARAAFFPLFPLLARWFDAICPGGDSVAALVMNTLLGLIAVVLVSLIAQRLYGPAVARTTATLVALFPGSFVLSFAYSEALMLVLAAACLLMLLDREWVAAGLFAALATATRPNALALVVACAAAAFVAVRERRDWTSLAAVLMAPIGFATFQIWLGEHTGEYGVWFRVQREAWDEGASFGWTAVRNTVEALATPLESPTDTITAISVATTVVLVALAWRAKLPWFLTLYSWAILALMLAPATVTARPRFLFTAFPLLIGAARWYEQRERHDDVLWPITMAASGAGLAALTGLYGVFGAIP